MTDEDFDPTKAYEAKKTQQEWLAKCKLFYQSLDCIAQRTQEASDYCKFMDEKKDQKIPAKTTSINAITRSYPASARDKASSMNEGSTGTVEKDTKVSTGLAKRDKKRNKKIIQTYKTCPNMDATK